MAIETNDLHRERDQLHAQIGNVMRMLEGVRAGDGSYTFAVVTMTCNAAENALEAALNTVRRVKSECRLTTHQRKLPGPAFDPSRVVRPSSALPATVSPCAAE